MITQVVVKLEDSAVSWFNLTEWNNLTTVDQQELIQSQLQALDIAALVGETNMWGAARLIEVDPFPQSTDLVISLQTLIF